MYSDTEPCGFHLGLSLVVSFHFENRVLELASLLAVLAHSLAYGAVCWLNNPVMAALRGILYLHSCCGWLLAAQHFLPS